MITGDARSLTSSAAFGVALLVFLIFRPAIWNNFVNWDDYGLLLEHTSFRGLGLEQVAYAFTSLRSSHYHPVTWLSFSIDHALWGLDPRGYHLTNVVLHAISAAVIFLFARRLYRRAGLTGALAVGVAPAVAALAFALHPLRVEPVAWITARRDVLSGLFFFLTLLAYVRALDALDNGQPRVYRRGLALALLTSVLALLSKSITMTLPAVLLLLDVYPLRRRLGNRQLWVEKLLFGAPALVTALVAAWAVGPEQFNTLRQYGIVDRLAMAAYSFAFYLWRTVLPANLSPVYEVPAKLNALELRFVLSVALVVALSLIALAVRRRAPWLTAAWGYHVLTILPVSGLVHAGWQLAYDRYSYLPGLAWAVLGGGALAALFSENRRWAVRAPIVVALCVVVLVTLGAWTMLTRRQIDAWHDSFELWTRALLVDPTSCAVCHHNLGLAYREAGFYLEAEEAFSTALAIRPSYFQAKVSLADVMQRLGCLDDALEIVADAQRAHADDPDLLAHFTRFRAMLLLRGGRS